MVEFWIAVKGEAKKIEELWWKIPEVDDVFHIGGRLRKPATGFQFVAYGESARDVMERLIEEVGVEKVEESVR